MAQNPASLIFDLDGTLLDTAPDLEAALNDLLVEHGAAALPEGGVRRLVGRGAIKMIERGFEFSGLPLPNGVTDELRRRYLKFYRARMTEKTVAFPGMVEALDRFADRGHRMAVCTNKQLCFAVPILARMGLDHYFRTIIGSDSLAFMKPHPLPLMTAIRRAGGDPAHVVMIGDSVTDVETARAAGIPIILVSFGYTDTPATKLGGDVVIDHFDELSGALAWLRDR